MTSPLKFRSISYFTLKAAHPKITNDIISKNNGTPRIHLPPCLSSTQYSDLSVPLLSIFSQLTCLTTFPLTFPPSLFLFPSIFHCLLLLEFLSTVFSFYMFSLNGCIHFLLRVPIHESAVPVSPELQICTYYINISQALQTHHVPNWTHWWWPNLLLLVFPITVKSTTNQPIKVWKSSLIFSLALTVSTQAFINYLLPILLHFAVSSFALHWTLYRLHLLSCTLTFAHATSLSWSTPCLPVCPPRHSSGISPCKTSVTLAMIGYPTLNSIIFVETYVICTKLYVCLFSIFQNILSTLKKQDYIHLCLSKM